MKLDVHFVSLETEQPYFLHYLRSRIRTWRKGNFRGASDASGALG